MFNKNSILKNKTSKVPVRTCTNVFLVIKSKVYTLVGILSCKCKWITRVILHHGLRLAVCNHNIMLYKCIIDNESTVYAICIMKVPVK